MPLHSPVFLSELETAGFPVNDRSGKVPKQMTSRRSLDERNPGPFQRRINSVPPQRVRINVNETIGSHEQFSDRCVIKLRRNLTSIGKVDKRGRCFLDLPNKRSRVEFGILCDVVCSILHVFPGRIGPDYFSSHRAIRRSTSSCEITSPRSAASRPFWIF